MGSKQETSKGKSECIVQTFKYRLKQVGKTLLTYIVTLAGLLLLMWLATLIPQAVFYWITGPIIILFFCLMIGAFIYWLFIEPFKKEK